MSEQFDDGNSLAVICPMCNGDEAIDMGRLGNLHWFRCRQCGAEYNLREFEALQAKLMRWAEQAGYEVAERGDCFILPATFERTDGSTYELQWAVKAGEGGPAYVRRLLDDQWHTCHVPSLEGVLGTIEFTEIVDTKRAWPEQPEYQAKRLVRAAELAGRELLEP